MSEISVSNYMLSLLRDSTTPVRFSHFAGEHTSKNWTCKMDLNKCKINFFVEGYSNIIVNGKNYAVEPGDIMLYRPHDVHLGNILYANYIEYYQLEFYPEELEALLGGEELCELFSTSGNAVQIRPGTTWVKKLGDSFARLHSYVGSRPDFCDTLTHIEILSILYDINICSRSLDPVESVSSYPKPLCDALRFIRDNYRDEITTEKIAGATLISRSYLNKLFKEYLSCSPHQYLLMFRLSVACDCLAGGMSVTETALEVGFHDSSSFAASFKRVYKLSPTEFCREVRPSSPETAQ